MLRDEVGAKSTNLLPSDKPNDIYQDTAGVTVEMLKEDINKTELLVPVKQGKSFCSWSVGDVARTWLNFGVLRDITKRPVMTMPYGSTRQSCKEFIMEAVQKRGEHPFGDYLLEACGYLSGVVWTAISKVVVAARLAMNWLQEAARVAASKDLPISWVAPSGFPVLQGYVEMEHKRVKLAMGDSVIKKITLTEHSEKLDRRRQANGISPNFVHSCDAAALASAVGEAVDNGIVDLACVHDSFGTHAANTGRFVACIKRTFVQQYEEHDVLNELKTELEGLGIELPPLPPRGTLRLGQVLESTYCFA